MKKSLFSSIVLENQRMIEDLSGPGVDSEAVISHLEAMNAKMTDIQTTIERKMTVARKLKSRLAMLDLKNIDYDTRVTMINFIDMCAAMGPKKKEPEIWVIDGNIGAGKTSLVDALSRRLHNNRGVVVTPEPLHKWQEFLPIYYSDPPKYATLMQSLVATAHTENVNEVVSDPKNNDVELFIFERDVQSCNIFAKSLGLDEQARELINRVVDKFSEPKKILVHPVRRRILVDTPPEQCLRRIARRSRRGEDLVKLSFLEELHKHTLEYYNSYRGDKWVLLNGELETGELVEKVMDLIEEHFSSK